MKLLFLFGTLLICLASGVQAEPKKIGVLYPMSGEYAEQGLHSIQGIKLAIEETGPTSDAEYIFEDAGSDSGAKLATAVKNLLEQKKVNFIIGPGMIQQALVVAAMTAKLGIPLVTSALCSEELLKFKNVVCGYPSTKDQLVDLKKIAEKFQIKSLAFVSDNSAYGTEVGAILLEMKKAGVFELLPPIELDSATDSERAVATKLVRSKADAIFSTTLSTAVSLNLFKRLAEQKFNGTRIGFLDVDSSMLKGFGETLIGVLLPGYVTSVYLNGFRETYQAKFGSAPDMYAAICHDMLLTLVEASKIDSSEAGFIRTITKVKASKVALKSFHFNEDRSISLPLETLEIGVENLAPVSF